MAKNPFHQLDVIRKASFKGNVIKDCYRLMFRKELWHFAYRNINYRGIVKKKKRATLLNLTDLEEWIHQLKEGTFRFFSTSDLSERSQAKFNLKNELALEVMTLILNAVFQNTLHPFKNKKSVHLTLTNLRTSLTGLNWCLVGDLNLTSTSITSPLLHIISNKIDDRRFLLFIHNVLRQGILDGKRNPQLQIKNELRPLFLNILLHGFEQEIITKLQESDSIQHVRYEDKFIIGIKGSRGNIMRIKKEIKNYLSENRYLYIKDNQLAVRHLKDSFVFLGYELCLVREDKIRRIPNEVQLWIPSKKIKEFAQLKGYGELNPFKVKHRPSLMNKTELEILAIYNKELLKLAAFYKLAANYNYLYKLAHLARGSFIKTIAYKRKSTSSKVTKQLKSYHQGNISLMGSDKKIYHFVKLNNLRRSFFYRVDLEQLRCSRESTDTIVNKPFKKK